MGKVSDCGQQPLWIILSKAKEFITKITQQAPYPASFVVMVHNKLHTAPMADKA